MSEMYQPRPEDLQLPPITELLSDATVNEGDRQRVAREWRNDPPDKDFDGILDAEIVDE